MKKYSVIILSLVIIACAETLTEQQKVEKGVQEYLKKNLNDANSYESVEFTSFEKQNAEKEAKKKHVKDSVSSAVKNDQLMDKANDAVNGKQSSAMDSLDMAFENLEKALDNLHASPKNTEFSIIHKYRAKNKLGALVIDQQKFFLDSLFNVLEVRETK